jgi:hypothetical protein
MLSTKLPTDITLGSEDSEDAGIQSTIGGPLLKAPAMNRQLKNSCLPTAMPNIGPFPPENPVKAHYYTRQCEWFVLQYLEASPTLTGKTSPCLWSGMRRQ